MSYSSYGTMPEPGLAWPAKQPDAVLDYDLTVSSIPAGDYITTASASAAPSGAGEMTVNSIALANGNQLILWLGGGVPGRQYLIKIECTTAESRTFEWVISISISRQLAVFPLYAPPALGFGAIVSWSLT